MEVDDAAAALILPRKFNWKTSGAADTGFIAQEVQQFAPELISTDARGYQSVDYARLSTYALAHCRRLERISGGLANQVFVLNNTVKDLWAKLGALQPNPITPTPGTPVPT